MGTIKRKNTVSSFDELINDETVSSFDELEKKNSVGNDSKNGAKKSELEIPSTSNDPLSFQGRNEKGKLLANFRNDPPKKVKRTDLVTEDFNTSIYQIKKEDNKNNVVTNSEILGSIKILDEDIPSSILDKSGYRKSLQQRLSLKQPSELDLQVIAAKTKKPIEAVKEYAIGKDGKGIMLEFDGIKAKKSTQLNQLLQSANKDLGLNDSFDAVFSTPETAKAYLDKIQQAYDTKTEQDFNLVNTVEVDGKQVQYTGEFYPERMLEKNFGEGQRIYNLMKSENSGKVNALKGIIGEDIIEKVSKKQGLTYDQKAQEIGKLVYGKDLKQIEEAYNKRGAVEALSAINPMLKLGGIFRDEKEEKKNLNAINSIAEVKLNNAIKEQLIYDQAVLNDTLQEAMSKAEAGTLSDTDRTAYQNKVEQLKKGIEEKQAEYKTPKQLQDKYPVLLKQSLIADINEFNAIKSGNVKQYEDGGYENTNLVQHLIGKGYDMNSQVVKDVIVDAAMSGKEIKDYSFFGSPIKSMTETFTSAIKSLGDITGLRDDVTILSEKKAGELFPTTVGENDELQLSGAAKVGQNIGNTTGQVLGQGLLQAGTAGLGRLAGLSKLAAANSGFWSSGALTSYDAAYKDGYDFIDSNAGRTAYAGLIALSNAASEKIFPEAKLFNIPGVKSAIAELASKAGTKELTEKLANQLLTKAKNAFIDYGKKYASNVGKETLEETATSLFESGARFVFGDPNINYDKAIENAKNTAIQTAIGTSLIGGMGVHKDVQQEKNIAPSSVIYNAAVYKDEAIDALNIGHDQGLYDQQELNKKISLLNTAEVGLSELKKAEDVFGRELSRPQKELFVANYTAQKLLNEQKKETGEPVIIAKIDERLKNLQNQQTQLLENKAQFDDFGNVAVNTKLSEPIEGVDEQGIPVGDNVPTPVKIESAVIEIGGKQYEGKNHAEAILAAQTDGQDISNVDRQEEGKFKLSDGSIIDRAEAKKQFGQDRSELIIPQDKATNNANKEYAKQLFEKEKTNRGLGVYGSMTAEVAIKEIAKQAQGVTETGEADTPEMTERVYKSTVNQFGKQLTDAAIKAHPIESLLNKAINSKGEPENISQPIELSITPANTEADKGVGDKISAIVDKVVNKKEKLTDEEKQFVEDNKSEVSTAVGKAVIAKNKPNQNTAVENNNVEDNSTQGLLKKYNEDTKYNIYDLVNDIEKSGDVNLKNAVAKYREEQAYDNETSGRNDMTAAEDNFIAAVEQSLSNKQEVVEPKPEIKNEEPIKVKPISDKVKSKFSKIKNKSSETKTIVNKKRTVKAIEVKAADAADNNSPEAAAEVVQEIDNLIGLTAEQQARALGEKEVDGTVVKRQKPLKEIVVGKEVDILFTKNDKEAGNYAVIERSALQPSHKSGVANELHFIPEAQPRDRGGLEVLRNEAKNKSDKLDPNQLADNNIAYFGAPVVNERGEVIQGNGRAEAIDYYYGNDKKDSRGYKEMLQQKASSLGLDAAAIAEMKEPVLVKLTKANDERAIELGNYSAGELEDVKQKGADIKAAFNRLTPAKIAELSATINSKIDETTTLKQIIRDNVRVVLDKLFDLGALRKDNKEQYIKEGEVTPDGIQAAYDIVRKLLFEGGTSDLEAKFDSLPFNTREAIEKTIPAILNNTELKLKVQEAIEIMRDQQESGTSSFATWRIQRDIFGDQKMPSEKYQKELLDFAQGITEAKTQKPIAERIVKLSKAMNETPADMFSTAIPAKNFEEAYNQPDIKFAISEKADTELQQMKDIVRDIQNEYADKDEPITLDEIKSIAESELGPEYNEQLIEDAYNEAGKQSRAFKKATAIQNQLAKRIEEFTGSETIVLPNTAALLSKAEELQNGVQFQKPDSGLLKAENDAIEKWLDDEYENIEGADVEEGYVSFDWDGSILEIFQGRNKAPLEFTKDELIEKGVEFPKNKESRLQFQITDNNDKKVTVQSMPEVVNGFYSPLEKTINEFKGDKLPVKQWAEKFKGEEAKWTGLTDWLNSQTGSVSKTDIQNFLKENRIEVVEVVKGSKDAVNEKTKEEKLEDIRNKLRSKGYDLDMEMGGEWYLVKKGKSIEDYDEDNDRALEDLFNDAPQEVQDLATQHNEISENSDDTADGETKYSGYQLPGEKTNYKEVLVMVPAKPLTFEEYKNESARGGVIFGNDARAIESYNDYLKEPGKDFSKSENFRSSHFDEPNILVHLRSNIRTDAEGNKVYFVEEIKSDYAQAGRKNGFKNSAENKKEQLLYQLGGDYMALRKEWGVWADATKQQKQDELSRIKKRLSDNGLTEEEFTDSVNKWGDRTNRPNEGIEPAPFVTDTNAWTKLAFKVALKEAVKQGADKISWTNGSQQAERYDLSKTFRYLEIKEDSETGNYTIEGIPAGSNQAALNEIASDIPANKLADYVGKEIAEKAIKGYQEFEVEDLKVGGKGMLAFYGNPASGNLGIVGNVAKSLFKQEPKMTKIFLSNERVKDSQGDLDVEVVRRGKKWLVFNPFEGEEYEFESESKAWDYADSLSKKGDEKIPSIQHSINITPELKQQVESGLPLFMKSPDGEILGFTHEGKIYLNGEKLNPNTPVHEAGHIWVEVAKEKMPLIYKRGIELINGSNYLRKVQSNEFYQQEAAKLPKGERKAYFEHEALAAAIGDKGAQFVTEARRKSFIDWAKDLWNRIAQIAGFKNITAKELQDMTLEDFAKRAAADILRGKEPIELGTYTIKNRKDGETTGIAEPAVEGEEPKLSGIRKKLVSEKIIENVDLNRIGDKDMMELGRKIIDSGEINPELLVQKIITEKQGVLTPGEVVALITYKADIDNKLRDAYRQANEKKDSGEDLGTLGIEIKDLERQVDDFDVMAVITANQQSMAFRLRRMMLDRNYNVITQIEKYKKNNDGYIPPEIEARFRELDKELKEVKEKLANAERLAAEKEGQDAVDNIKESVGREKTYTDEQLEKKIQEGVESEISKLYEELPSEKRGLADKAIAALEKFRSKIKANGSAYDATIGIPIAIADLGAATAIRAIKVGKTVAQAVEMGINRIKKALKEKGIDKWDKEADYRKDLTETLEGEGVSIKPVKDKATINEDGTVSIPNQMLRDLVKRGVTDINDFTDAVHEQVVKDLPDITKRQVRDYITNYGKEVNKTADEIQTQINTAKRVGKLLSELEDLKTMGKVEFFAKYQKQKPADNKITEREKELKQQIKSLSKDIIGDTGVDKVGKDAAERHQKRIDDLEKELERLQFRRNKEKKQPNKSEREIPEDEQKILDEIEAEQTKWDEEKDSARQLAKDYQKMETERNRQLARVSELNEAIKTLEGGNLPQGETKVAKKDTPEIEALKAEKASLEKKVRESIAHENKMKELDKELQRLKDRKAKEPKAESKRIIGEEERLKRDEIEAERKAWAIENNIEKLNTELQRVRSRQQKVTDPKEKRELTDTEKGILQEIKDEKAVWAKEVEPERRVREALKSAQKSLKEYERRIAEKDFSKKDVTETPLTPELKSLREKRDAKRKEYEKLKKDTVPKIPKTDAEILKAAKERARARIEQLTTKLKNKDFAKPVKKIAVTDTELADLITRKEKLQDEFDDAQYKLELKNRTFWQKAEDAALELTSGLVRGLVASLDMSAGFVQGLWRLFSNPINSAKAFGTMFNHFKSEKASQDYMDKLKAQPYYPLLQASKLAIDDKSGKISAREGFFISNWVNHIYDFAAKVITLNYKPATQFLQRINPYKASARAFDGYVNSIRVNSFIDLAKSMEKDGYTFEADSKDFEKAADFVNTTTGRGSLGKADASSRWLNIFFFAPRKVISEVKLFTPYAFVYYARMPKSVRKKALLNLATFMGNFVLVNGLLWAASKAAGGDDEEDDNFWNANSSDFLTHKIGNKRVSIAGGAKSMLVFQSRLWSGKFTDQYGNTEKLGERYGKPINTRLDLVWRFVLGKGSPAVSVIAKKFDEKKGVESSDGEIIKDLTVPIWMQDLKELYKDSPKEVSTLLAALSFFGANVRTVDEGNKKKSGFKIYSTSIKGENGVRYSTPKEDKEVIEYKDIKTEEKLKAIKERGTVWLNKYGEMTINEDENVSTKPYKELSDDEIKDLKSRLREQAGREAKMKIKF